MAASNVLTSSSPRSPDWSWSIMSRAWPSMMTSVVGPIGNNMGGGFGVVGAGLTTYEIMSYHLSLIGSGMRLESHGNLGNFAFVVWHIHQNHCATSMFTTPTLLYQDSKISKKHCQCTLTSHLRDGPRSPTNSSDASSQALPCLRGGRSITRAGMDERSKQRDCGTLAVLRLYHERLGYLDWLDEMW